MGSNLDENAELVRERSKKHTFETEEVEKDSDEDNENNNGEALVGLTDHFQREKIKLKNLETDIQSQATSTIAPAAAADTVKKGKASAAQLEVVKSQETKYDNFYTPQNQAFYNQFEYVGLDRKECHIRLLRIHPIQADEDDNATVRCDVVDDVPLASMGGKFTTLSYCAGEPKKTESILVNGIRFNAFANLGHALRQVRHYWSKNRNGEELLLWADQVCIDQSNSNERSHQVNFMGDIYAAAAQVLICLSVEGSPTGGLKWLKSAMETIARLKWSVEEFSYEHFLELNWSNEHLHRGWDAFIQTCLTSPWFMRAWVRQEFFRSQEAIFLAGFESVSYHDLLQCTTELPYTTLQLHLSKSISPCQREKRSAPFSICGLCRLLEDPSHLDYTWRNITRFLMRKRNHSNDLVVNLSGAFFCQSSDQRDLIYAFLGCSVDCYHIFPNYNPSVSYASLCTQLALNYLRHTGNLNMMVEAYTRTVDWASRDLGIPSWVPDWRMESYFRFPGSCQDRPVSKAEFSFQESGEDHALSIITTRGLLLFNLDRRINHYVFHTSRVDNGSEYWTDVGVVRAWGASHEGAEVWILLGTSQAYVFGRKGQYHELRGGMMFLQTSEEQIKIAEEKIEFETGNSEHHRCQMAILMEKVNRLVEDDDPSIQTINIC